MIPMHITHRQEAFSRAYLHAVAAAAGFRVQEGAQPDDDSVDLTLAARGPGGTVRSPKLDVQLKCQRGLPPAGPSWPFDLKAKNHEDLRHADLQVPRILVVVAVPEELNDWLHHDEEHMLMRYCAWWVSLRGADASSNTATVRVQVPRAQRLDVAGLTGIMSRVALGELP
jgi:hypothetical protein